MPLITTALEELLEATLSPVEEERDVKDVDDIDETAEEDAEETGESEEVSPPQANKVPTSKTVKKYFLFIYSSYQKIN